MKNNIILLGMMGAGKSTIAKLLKEVKTEFQLIDLDIEIEQKKQLTITEIFSKFGENYFRQLETELIKTICTNNNQIISLGGGAFETPENRTVLKENGITIYLKATPEELFNRIKSQTHRPLLKTGFDENNVKEILKKREQNYELADITIDTNYKPFYNIINEILKRIENVL